MYILINKYFVFSFNFCVSLIVFVRYGLPNLYEIPTYAMVYAGYPGTGIRVVGRTHATVNIRQNHTVINY